MGVKTSLRDVQAQLMYKLDAKDILIGHSLESDLRAVKMLHSKVVDTSVVFPHKMGPPFKRALRTIAVEQIQRIIQDAIRKGRDIDNQKVEQTSSSVADELSKLAKLREQDIISDEEFAKMKKDLIEKM